MTRLPPPLARVRKRPASWRRLLPPAPTRACGPIFGGSRRGSHRCRRCRPSRPSRPSRRLARWRHSHLCSPHAANRPHQCLRYRLRLPYPLCKQQQPPSSSNSSSREQLSQDPTKQAGLALWPASSGPWKQCWSGMLQPRQQAQQAKRTQQGQQTQQEQRTERRHWLCASGSSWLISGRA